MALGQSRGSVAIVGGGLSGSLLALKLAKAWPDRAIFLIEPGRRLGRGLAYGACSPEHLLNVPAARMESGLTPGFRDWLEGRRERIADAIAEAGGDLSAAFVPRILLGDYLEERVAEARSDDPTRGLVVVRGEAVQLLDPPRRGLRLLDGREVHAETIVLATGNLPPAAPLAPDAWLRDAAAWVPDPWAVGALDGIDPDAPLVLIGAGLTMVDIVLRLAASGHRGPMHALSRRGLPPQAHRFGGAWEPFLGPHLPASPARLMRLIRREAETAEARGVPWQRVIDAVRPAIAGIWAGWSDRQRLQFLRHQRARWDVHRHRMAPRVAADFQALIDGGRLTLWAGRIRASGPAPPGAFVELAPRGGGPNVRLQGGRVINCTGPRSDLKGFAGPLFTDLSRRGLLSIDTLGLGLDTDDCAVLDARGRPSDWLYALGPLTRPAWWEVTAAPEIAAQVDRLTLDLIAPPAARRTTAPLAAAFLDLGAGI
ncbi:MAG: hypothetical protein JWP35_58 [Caulobacter sp.]|nr:hypothetical protein [Caulobacter sp.]